MGPFRRLHHICLVVADLDSAVAHYESIGIGPWQDFPPLTDFTDTAMPNPAAFLAMRYKLTDLDNIQLQLCQPPEADCPQRRFLDRTGGGVFHLGFAPNPASDADPEAAAREFGLPVLMRGQRADGSGFIYYDTAAESAVVLMNRINAKEIAS